MKRIILASQSPGKKIALESLKIPFEVIPSNYKEDMTLSMTTSELALVLSTGKATNLSIKFPEAIIIGVDTFVVFRNKLMGKPKDLLHAKEMLNELAGNTHTILSGLTVIGDGKEIKKVVKTRVTFRSLTEKEIEDYIATGESMDKAGSYAIQGEGKSLIESIDGEYYNIMGMPLETLIDILNTQFGFKITHKPKNLF